MNGKVGRTKILSMFALVLMLLSVPLMSALAAGLLNLPPGDVSATQVWGGTMGSTIDVTLSGVPSGYDVMDGNYPGWCIEDNFLSNHPLGLFILVDSTGDPAPEPCISYHGKPWDKVNYLLNHRNGTVQEVQAALWLLIWGSSSTFPVTVPAQAMYDDAMTNGGDFVPGDGQVVAVILCGDGIGWEGFQDALIEVPLEPPDGEGCTPGYWRNLRKHLEQWEVYTPFDDFEVVFGVDASFSPTLLGSVVKLGGGGEKALARHAVAALLNATNPDVEYLYTEAEIIAFVQAAYASRDFETYKDLLEAQNADLTTCPID